MIEQLKQLCEKLAGAEITIELSKEDFEKAHSETKDYFNNKFPKMTGWATPEDYHKAFLTQGHFYLSYHGCVLSIKLKEEELAWK